MKNYLVPFTVALISHFKQAEAIQTHAASVLAQVEAGEVNEAEYLYGEVGSETKQRKSLFYLPNTDAVL